MHKIQDVDFTTSSPFWGCEYQPPTSGVPKNPYASEKWEKTGIFQIETVNCWKKWRLAGNCCNEGFLRQIPPGCLDLAQVFLRRLRELTPNHPTVTIQQNPTIPKCISLFTPSKKTRKQLLEAVWKKKHEQQKPKNEKKKKKHRVEHPIFGLFVELQDRFQTIHMARPRWKSSFPPVREAKKNLGDLWVWFTLIFIHVTCWYTCTGCTCIYMLLYMIVETTNDKHKSHKSILQSSYGQSLGSIYYVILSYVFFICFHPLGACTRRANVIRFAKHIQSYIPQTPLNSRGIPRSDTWLVCQLVITCKVKHDLLGPGDDFTHTTWNPPPPPKLRFGAPRQIGTHRCVVP